ncbi:MAG: cobalamin biosynthesis protein CobQ [Oscillospiraceae bacterium]|nr:cobalamin biosynthesis protein CobQ [Oscillospiraceae bacterium]
MKKINIVTGHYGSGKTNFSANLAVSLADRGERVTAVDLDIVNPYFRSADFGELFSGKNVELVAPMYANSNLDIPAISFDLERIVSEDGYVVIDVGGDDAGAIALGRYAEAFSAYTDRIDMLYVVNCRRFLTRTASEALELMYEIEAAANMKHTAIVNNTNLLYETTAEVLEQSEGFAKEIAEKAGLPIAYTCVPLGISSKVTNPFPVEIYVKKVWEEE